MGNALGDAGVSAINIVFPAVALTFALGSGIGLGGAVIWSIESGRGNLEKDYKSLKVALNLTGSRLFNYHHRAFCMDRRNS